MYVIIVSHTQENKEVTIVFYIHESMDIVSREQIQNHLLKANGIVSVEFDHFRPHLLCVDYIPTLIQSSLIMSHLVEHNLHPHLVVGI
jgi:hypothetical protein